MKPKTVYSYKAVVLRWFDGDTVRVELDLGFDVSVRKTVRLAGVDAPELRAGDVSEKTRARTALAFAASLAPPGSVVQATTVPAGDKYGRFLADLRTDDGEDVATALVQAGHAVAYAGGRRG